MRSRSRARSPESGGERNSHASDRAAPAAAISASDTAHRTVLFMFLARGKHRLARRIAMFRPIRPAAQVHIFVSCWSKHQPVEACGSSQRTAPPGATPALPASGRFGMDAKQVGASSSGPIASEGHPPVARHDERERCAGMRSQALRGSCAMTDRSLPQAPTRPFDPERSFAPDICPI